MDVSLDQIRFGNCDFSFFEEEGNFFFRANDLAKFLGYDLTANMLKLVKNMKPNIPLRTVSLMSSGQSREYTFLTESQVYKILFRSNKPEAQPFQDWLSEEVIPSIRKRGVYQTNNRVLQLEEEKTKLENKALDIAQKLAEANEKIKSQEKLFSTPELWHFEVDQLVKKREQKIEYLEREGVKLKDKIKNQTSELRTQERKVREQQNKVEERDEKIKELNEQLLADKRLKEGALSFFWDQSETKYLWFQLMDKYNRNKKKN